MNCQEVTELLRQDPDGLTVAQRSAATCHLIECLVPNAHTTSTKEDMPHYDKWVGQLTKDMADPEFLEAFAKTELPAGYVPDRPVVFDCRQFQTVRRAAQSHQVPAFIRECMLDHVIHCPDCRQTTTPEAQAVLERLIQKFSVPQLPRKGTT